MRWGILIGALLVAGSAYAEPSELSEAIKQCAAVQPHDCSGSCSGHLAAISRCAVLRVAPSAPRWVVDACVAKVFDETRNQPMAFHRTPAVLHCVTGK
jgi:hypothetical protein